jgi:hypothetical protein
MDRRPSEGGVWLPSTATAAGRARGHRNRPGYMTASSKIGSRRLTFAARRRRGFPACPHASGAPAATCGTRLRSWSSSNSVLRLLHANCVWRTMTWLTDRTGALTCAGRSTSQRAACLTRRAAVRHRERALEISKEMGDRHLESQGFDHGLVAVQKAEEGDFSGAEAHLRDGGTALLRVADRGETGLDPGTVHGLRWSWGQRVADQAIDANNPGLAVEVMDRLSTDLGPPPPAQRPSHELARFAATLQSGEELSPREVLESARTISEGSAISGSTAPGPRLIGLPPRT